MTVIVGAIMGDIVCGASCRVTIGLDLVTPILSLTVEEGGLIAVSILLVWSVGFAVRMVIRALASDHSPLSGDE